jgi:hypothetical protein
MARGPKRAPLGWLLMRVIREKMLEGKEDGNGSGKCGHSFVGWSGQDSCLAGKIEDR